MLFYVGVEGLLELPDFPEDDVVIGFDGGEMFLHGGIVEIVIEGDSPSL